MTGGEAVISVDRLRKCYRRRTAVNDVSFTVARGEIFGLIGPDGAGKSSTLKAIAGVLAYDGGQISVLGTTLDSESAAERVKGRLGFMPQGLGLNLYADLSVEENIDFFARLRLVERAQLEKRKAQLLAATRLAPFRNRPMHQLSGGMKQKLGLICTLIHGPELIILDEPTTGVDPVSRQDFWEILGAQVAEEGMTALVSTAYLDEASRFHRVALFSGGQLLLQGTPAELQKASPASAVQGAARERAQDLEEVFIETLERQPGATHAPPLVYRAPSRAENDTPAIEARALTKSFGSFRAVDAVTLEVYPGEVFGLLGANGAGKSTVIRMLTGLVPLTSGSGRVGGVDLAATRRKVRERMGYMSQAFSLYLDLTVTENVRLFGGIYGLERQVLAARLDWILELAGLRQVAGMRAEELSMGMRQRLALGCAIVHKPGILFLDEPTSGVDPIGRRQFWRILFDLARDERVAVLVTTHYMTEAERCDRLGLMFAGRMVASDTPRKMKADLQAEAGPVLELATSDARSAARVLEGAGFQGVSRHGDQVHVLLPDGAAPRARLESTLHAGGVELVSAEARPLTMEDVFVYRVLQLEKRDDQAKRA